MDNGYEAVTSDMDQDPSIPLAFITSQIKFFLV